MISDSLSCLGRYLGIHPALDTAIRWLGANDLNALPTGCTEVDGRTVYINVMDAGCAPPKGPTLSTTTSTPTCRSTWPAANTGPGPPRPPPPRPLTLRPTAALPPGPSSPAACWGRGGSPCSCPGSTTSPAASAPCPARSAKRWSRSVWAADPPRKGGNCKWTNKRF